MLLVSALGDHILSPQQFPPPGKGVLLWCQGLFCHAEGKQKQSVCAISFLILNQGEGSRVKCLSLEGAVTAGTVLP